MSGLILRCCRRGVARARSLPASLPSCRNRLSSQPASLPSCRNRHFSSGSSQSFQYFSEKPPPDNGDKFLIGSAVVVGGCLTKIYIDFFADSPPDVAIAVQNHHAEKQDHQVDEEKPQEEAKEEEQPPQAEEAKEEEQPAQAREEEQQEARESGAEQVSEEVEELKSKAEESDARALRLEKELEQANQIKAKLQQDIQSLLIQKNEIDAKNESSDTGKEKLRLANEMNELKQQIESMGFLGGSDLDKSFLLRKLATVMGVFAFERAMVNGEPLENAVVSLQGGDALITAAISSLPEEAVKGGSPTPLDLQSRFIDSKPKLRELALVPGSGGGAVSHLIARGASNLKVKEENSSDDGGLESVLEQVESLIKHSNFAEAGKVLEEAVQGTEAEALAAEWAAQARLRASVEQVHDVLRAHAASISMSFA